jgi:hypothetical protein
VLKGRSEIESLRKISMGIENFIKVFTNPFVGRGLIRLPYRVIKTIINKYGADILAGVYRIRLV